MTLEELEILIGKGEIVTELVKNLTAISCECDDNPDGCCGDPPSCGEYPCPTYG